MSRVRVACHIHSEWSFDASWSLDALASAFARRGYGALLLCEHHQSLDEERWRQFVSACSAASSDAVLLVPGIEYACSDNLVHVPTWGVGYLGPSPSYQEVLAAAASRHGVAILAHPMRRDAYRSLGVDVVSQFTGVEGWNRKYDGWTPGRVPKEWRNAARAWLVALDFHSRRQFFPLSLEIEHAGHSLTVAETIEVLRSGQARATAWGMPLHWFWRPPLHQLTVLAERLRRPLAATLRLLQAGGTTALREMSSRTRHRRR